jgi:hypothetical protein
MEGLAGFNLLWQWHSQELIFSSLRGANSANLSKSFDQNQIFNGDLQAIGGPWPLLAPLGYATVL